MSCLKLYAPDEFSTFDEPQQFEPRVVCDEDEPEILSWRTVSDRFRNQSMMELLARSKALYRNKQCRSCHRPTVEPIERDDALLGKNRLPIPGSATLVGFHCQHCNAEWHS